MSDAYKVRVSTALDRLEAAEKDLSLAAKRVNEAREVLRTAFRDEREGSESSFCSAVDCSCGEGGLC